MWSWSTVSSADPVCRMFRGVGNAQRPYGRPMLTVQAVLTSLRGTKDMSSQPLPKPMSTQVYHTDMNQLYSNCMQQTNDIRARVSGFLQSLATRLQDQASKINFQVPNLSLFPTPASHQSDDSASNASKASTMDAFVSSGSTLDLADVRAAFDEQVLKQPLLLPFLERADRIEVLYASLVADLCNMAYEADKVDDSMLDIYNLALVSNSSQPLYGPITRESHWAQVGAAHASGNPQDPACLAADACMETPGYTVTAAEDYSLLIGSMEDLLDAMDKSSTPTPSALHATMAQNDLPCSGTSVASSSELTAPAVESASLECWDDTCQRLEKQETVNIAAAAAKPAAVLKQRTLPVDREGRPDSPQSVNLLTQPAPPAAWFVADDTENKVRYIVIQGSISLDHWAINLTFDPVMFEAPSLGTHVHRGVYEAALRLYDDLLPLVRHHLASSPSATLCLGGHSLGGSLASVLMMLLVHRGEIKPSDLAPCYTFGAPAVFCHGAIVPQESLAGGERLSADPDAAAEVLECSGSENGMGGDKATHAKPLMEQLEIPEELLVNVMMHKDIVPRAFVCDYSIVAGLLKRLVPSFKDHSTLHASHQHKHLYSFLGKVAVIRPDDGAHFVMDDADHPMLPNEPGLYRLQDPLHMLCLGETDTPFDSFRDAFPALAEGAVRLVSPAAAGAGDGAAVSNLRSALHQFMNHPHPLQTLSSHNSYGHNGAISRYHNPDNYKRGLMRLSMDEDVQEGVSTASAVVAWVQPNMLMGGAAAGRRRAVAMAARK